MKRLTVLNFFNKKSIHVKLRRSLTVIIFVVMMLITGTVYAKGINVYAELSDGQKISLNGLTSDQRQNTINNLERAIRANAPKIEEKVETVIPEITKIIEADPEKLDKWRKLIVGTIKDTCNDLNVTVNEFVKTPVGMGVVGLVAYEVVGRDLLTGTIRVTIAGIMWAIITIILGFTARYFLGSTLVYNNVEEIPREKGKPIIKRSDPEKKLRYPWRGNDARTVFGACIGIFYTVSCIVTITIMV